MLKKIILGSVAVASLMFAQENEIDINVNNDTYEVGGTAYLNNFYYLNDNSKYFFGAHFLGTDEDDKLSQKLINLDLKVMNSVANDSGFSLGLGIKGVYTDSDREDMMAVGLGVLGKYEYSDKFYVDASYHYAPEVLSYMDGDSYREARVNANYAVVNNGYIYTGLRRIKADFKNSVAEFDKSAFIGFKFKF